MTDAQQEALEMRCVRHGRLIGVEGSVKMFFMDAKILVGASEGFETQYVYAEHNWLGDVHGRPISEQELRRLGVRL